MLDKAIDKEKPLTNERTNERTNEQYIIASLNNQARSRMSFAN